MSEKNKVSKAIILAKIGYHYSEYKKAQKELEKIQE